MSKFKWETIVNIKHPKSVWYASSSQIKKAINILPVDELKNSVDIVGIGVAARFRLRSSFAHDNKLKIDDKTMTIATFIFAVLQVIWIVECFGFVERVCFFFIR